MNFLKGYKAMQQYAASSSSRALNTVYLKEASMSNLYKNFGNAIRL